MTEQNDKVEHLIDKLLLRLVVFMLCSLVAVQTALFMDSTRNYVSKTDMLEGEQLAVNRPGLAQETPVRTVLEPLQRLRRGKTLTISVLTPEKRPNVAVLINGQPAGNFQNGTVHLTVYENDYLAIDSARWNGFVRYKIEGDAGILLPMNGIELETKGDSAAIGRVRFK